MSRPWTGMQPNADETGWIITPKRCCNVCTLEIGDATHAEIEAAVAGLPLPDVFDECPHCQKALTTPIDKPLRVYRELA